MSTLTRPRRAVDSITPGLSLEDWLSAVARQTLDQVDAAGAYADWQEWLAGKIDELAQLVRFTHAANPAEHDGRIEYMQGELAERHYTDGFRSAQESLLDGGLQHTGDRR